MKKITYIILTFSLLIVVVFVIDNERKSQQHTNSEFNDKETIVKIDQSADNIDVFYGDQKVKLSEFIDRHVKYSSDDKMHSPWPLEYLARIGTQDAIEHLKKCLYRQMALLPDRAPALNNLLTKSSIEAYGYEKALEYYFDAWRSSNGTEGYIIMIIDSLISSGDKDGKKMALEARDFIMEKYKETYYGDYFLKRLDEEIDLANAIGVYRVQYERDILFNRVATKEHKEHREIMRKRAAVGNSFSENERVTQEIISEWKERNKKMKINNESDI